MPRLSRLLPVLGLGAGLACSSDHLTREPPVAPDALYWNLELNHHAVTLSLQAPYDTLTLVATPRNARGELLDGLRAPQYSSPDLDRVRVTAEGMLRAVGLTNAGQPIPVVATLTADNLKHVDTVLVKVVADTLPKLASLTIQRDSAKFPMREIVALPVRGIDSNGAPISDLLVAARSSDRLIAEAIPMGQLFGGSSGGSPVLRGNRPGPATVIASATVFGVAKADTVLYRVGWPIFWTVQLRQHVWEPATVRVGVGALIRWDISAADTVDVTFADTDLPNIAPADSSAARWGIWAALYSLVFGQEISPSFVRQFICSPDPSDCDGSGSFVLSPETYPSAYRVFSVPGTYEYHSTRYGITGRIIVMDEADE